MAAQQYLLVCDQAGQPHRVDMYPVQGRAARARHGFVGHGGVRGSARAPAAALAHAAIMDAVLVAVP